VTGSKREEKEKITILIIQVITITTIQTTILRNSPPQIINSQPK